MSMFCRYDLRTTDVEAARSFYTEVVGIAFEDPLGLWPLHEQARARGAPPHWLGQIGVPDLDATLSRLLAQGAERLGPTVQTKEGLSYATVRDPFGAVVAIRGSTAPPTRAAVAWHQHHTRDLERSWTTYAELFGWTHTETFEVADPPGGHRMFAWERGGASVGSMANTARWPGVHPHWTFYFAVADMDAAIAKVNARGGRVIDAGPLLPSGARVVPCEDPHGAAFGLHQRP